MKFAVSLLKPPNFPHAEALREVAETVHFGLLELGYESLLTQETNLPDRQHITLAPGFLRFFDTPISSNISSNSVLYNFEQIYLGSPWLHTSLLDHLLQYPVWDYASANIQQLEQLGVSKVQKVPIGYVPQLTRISQAEEDIDVLFYGSLNERRSQVIEALRERGVNAQGVFGIYGKQRDELIARAKIVLNLHFYPAKVFELVRVSYLLANRRFVVSERGCDPAEETEFEPGIVFAEYDRLVEICMNYLSRPREREDIADAGFQLMVQRPEAEFLQAALAATQLDDRATFSYQKDLYRKRLAVQQLEQKNYEAAIDLYEQSLEIDPDCLLSYWNLGLAHLLKGEEIAAQLCWATAFQREEQTDALSELLATLGRMRDSLKETDPASAAKIDWVMRELN